MKAGAAIAIAFACAVVFVVGLLTGTAPAKGNVNRDRATAPFVFWSTEAIWAAAALGLGTWGLLHFSPNPGSFRINFKLRHCFRLTAAQGFVYPHTNYIRS
jgi:hypothetical protein